MNSTYLSFPLFTPATAPLCVTNFEAFDLAKQMFPASTLSRLGTRDALTKAQRFTAETGGMQISEFAPSPPRIPRRAGGSEKSKVSGYSSYLFHRRKIGIPFLWFSTILKLREFAILPDRDKITDCLGQRLTGRECFAAGMVAGMEQVQAAERGYQCK